MVRYYGRAKERTAAVNTTQLGLKLAGCPSSVGRKGTLTRVIQRRVNCVLKVCGWRPVHGVTGRKPGIFNFPSEPTNVLAKEAWSGPFPCTLAQPFTRGVKGGIGHIYTPRTKCGCTCVADCSGMDDTFFPVGTPQYGLPRCAGGDCCFLVNNAPRCLTDNNTVECFPGTNWRDMVSTYFNLQIQAEALPPVDGGFDNRCWIPRSAFEGVPTQLAKLDQRLAEALAVGGLGPPLLNGLIEPLVGWDYVNNVQNGEIDWALLFVRATNSDCKETGRVGIWLLAKTGNSDFVPDSGPGETLTLYWMTPVTKTLTFLQPPLGGPSVWAGPVDITFSQSGLACFPVLRYHSDVRGVRTAFAGMPVCSAVPYTGDIGLDDCGCPEIPSGNPPSPVPAGTPSRFQNWGIYYQDQAYFDSNGMVPWGLPASILAIDGSAGGAWLGWIDWCGGTSGGGPSPPIPLGWMRPHECTFGASTILAIMFPQITTPPTGVFAWNCPDPPPGGGFLPILPP